MRLETYEFFFHPLSPSHETGTKVASVIVNVALTAITAGLYLLVFGAVRAIEACLTPKSDDQTEKAKKFIKKKGSSPQVKPSPTITHQPTAKPALGAFGEDSKKVAKVKVKQASHLVKLTALANKGQWQHLARHTAHVDSGFDWWMFPISRKSQHGTAWSVFPKDIQALKSDTEFMDSYRKGVKLVAKSWGWDLKTGVKVATGKWSGYQVRLGKMLTSLRLFGQDDLRRELLKHIQRDCQSTHFEGWIQNELSMIS